jgi:membrane-associated progesterone receptor component
MYGNFAGRDASRGMAKQSFDVGECFSSAYTFLFMNLIPLNTEMLTPVDQPIDKLEDLDQTEM